MRLNRTISIVVISWFIIILSIFAVGYFYRPSSGIFTRDYFSNLANWDGGHYVGIAQNGYSVKYQHAFFPLYPLMINVVGQLTGNLITASLLISFFSALLFFNLFYRYLQEEFNSNVAFRSIAALLFFPMSFYLITAHTESLFLFLAVGTFYFTKKNNLVLATIFVALASATRLIGLSLVVSFFLELFLTKKLIWKNWYVIFAPFGFLSYCFYLWLQTGDPLYFITAEKTWDRTITFPWEGIWKTILDIARPGNTLNIMAFLDFYFTIFGIFMVIKVFRTLSKPLALYSVICLLLPLLTPTLASMPRYILPIFPIFMVMGSVKNKFVWFLYIIVGSYLLVRSAMLFIGGFWVS